jgi:RimJ/RimL family protein N-acetyltransferase
LLPVIESRRVSLRPFTPDDADAAFGWFGDPEVMRFTPSGADRSLDQTKARLAKYQRHQNEYGFSKWIALDRQNERPIGDSGLLWLDDYKWIDFGYRLGRAHWGKGLATEIGLAWVTAAFNDLHLDRLTAIVHPENVASIRVIEKLGFRADRQQEVMGMQSIVYYLMSK